VLISNTYFKLGFIIKSVPAKCKTINFTTKNVCFITETINYTLRICRIIKAVLILFFFITFSLASNLLLSLTNKKVL
jgi:hypothetical protein